MTSKIKTVKELSFEFDKLLETVKILQLEIKSLKESKKDVTVLNKDGNLNKTIKCNQCDLKFKHKKELSSHINTFHTKKIACCKCDFVGKTLSEIDEHIFTDHGPDRNYKCDQCESMFLSELRLKKHLKAHDSNKNLNFCHYFNNAKDCPYAQYGCMFKHIESKMCRYREKCKKQLCQFKHKEAIVIEDSQKDVSDQNKVSQPASVQVNKRIEASDENTVISESNSSDKTLTETSEFSWTIIENNNKYKKGREFFCNQYCSMKHNIHLHDTKNLHKYKGAKVNEVEEKFIVENMTFVKIFICEVCDFKSKGFESHEMHFKDIHEDIKFTPACIFNHCEYESEIPVELVKHYSTKHKKAIEKK